MSLLVLYNIIIVFALKLSSSLLQFPPLVVLFVAISFVSCRHFKAMLLVGILPRKGLIRVSGQILDRIMSLVWNLWDQNANVSLL